jgi:SAM-dependent methyltransferase
MLDGILSKNSGIFYVQNSVMEINMDPVLIDTKRNKRRNSSFLVYHYLFKSLTYAIEKYGKGNVLDMGCGNKPYQSLFNNKITGYTGCDINQNKLNSVDIVCNILEIPRHNESFDTVLCTQVIEHVYDHRKLLAEANRLLRKGGVMILSGPLYWPEHGVPHDFFRFTRYGFQELLEECGFSVTEVQENGGAWATAGQSLAHAFEFSSNRSLFFRGLRFLYFRCRLSWIYNSIFKWFDKKDYNPVNTINFVIVATKN